MAKQEIKYLTSTRGQKRPKKYCRFKKLGIKYVDYKDGEFLKKFLNEQGKLLPRRITGNSLKYQRKVAQAVKKAGLEGKVFVFGIDGTEQLANMLLDPDNVLQAVTAQQPFEVGRLALEAANAVLDGKEVEKNQSVPVLPLTRTNPDGVKAFLEQLKALG